MEEQTLSQSDIITLISNILNELFGNLFASIDNTIYCLLDEITILNSDTLITSNLEKILSSDNFNIIILANILTGLLITYRMIKIIISLYTHLSTEPLYLYIIKTIIYTIILNSALFICSQIIDINFLISDFLLQLGSHLFNVKISFISFTSIINDSIAIDTINDMFSLSGIIKTLITFGMVELLITYILRFILTKLLIILSPFAFLCLIEESLVPYFKNWLKYFIILLISQNFIILVLYIPYIFDFDNSIYSKFLIVGTIYTLKNLNSYITDLLGGFNFTSQINISSIFKK